MKIENEMRVYCPYCNKHTLHKVKQAVKNGPRGNAWHTLAHNRSIRGYVGSVETKLKPKKLGKRQKVILECKECKKSVERVIHGRTKKKIEIKK